MKPMLRGSQPYVALTLRNLGGSMLGSMPRSVSSWMSGPESVGFGSEQNYPGQALGLPESGPGALARTGRRLAALLGVRLPR